MSRHQDAPHFRVLNSCIYGRHQICVPHTRNTPDLCTGFAVLQTLQAAMKDADVTKEQLDWLVLHQANQRILDAAAQRVGISSERVISNLAEYGNTSAASIPLAFDEAVRGGKIKSGDTVSKLGLRVAHAVLRVLSMNMTLQEWCSCSTCSKALIL